MRTSPSSATVIAPEPSSSTTSTVPPGTAAPVTVRLLLAPGQMTP